MSDVRQLPGDHAAETPKPFSGTRDGLTIEPTEVPPGYRLTGEIDVANANLLLEALSAFDAERGPLVLEMSGLTFLDSVGALALFQHAAELDGDGPMILADPSGIVQRVLEVLGFDAMEGVEIRRSATDG